MYSSKPAMVFGFHGLDQQVALGIVNQEISFKKSTNDYDWLGNGIYFWENNLERAYQYANESTQRMASSIKTPFVLGAIIDLGYCLDLLDQKFNDYLQFAYQKMLLDFENRGIVVPKNKQFGSKDFDFKNRELDCTVIRYACALAEEDGRPFDSVRAAFIEGEPLYPGAKFYRQNHIQLAIINQDCIKGVFMPREAKRRYI